MRTTAQGQAAERAVAGKLQKQGFEVLALNWKTRVCEIDIVARKHNVIYFVEVKFRRNQNQGTGLDYITPKKLKAMRFAAQIWIQTEEWGGDYRLAAVAVDESDQGYEVGGLVEVD